MSLQKNVINISRYIPNRDVIENNLVNKLDKEFYILITYFNNSKDWVSKTLQRKLINKIQNYVD